MNLIWQRRKALAIDLILFVSSLAFAAYWSRPEGATSDDSQFNLQASRLTLASRVPTKASANKSREPAAQNPTAPIAPPVITAPKGAAAVEQQTQGERPGATLVESFDGLGVGFEGPQGTANLRNPSDNSLAIGLNHIVQIVN